MRANRHGRASSTGGRFVLPTGGCYHASTYAVDAVSDALRERHEQMLHDWEQQLRERERRLRHQEGSAPDEPDES